VIIVDTSALIAVTNHEPERQKFLGIIAATDRCFISAVTLLEVRIVTFGRFGADGLNRLTLWLATFSPEIVPFDSQQSDAAILAFKTFGKGVHSKAKLNFGDCASYALAKSRDLPLLFKGDDFAATDIKAAV
jgi:ribonuclease VapC